MDNHAWIVVAEGKSKDGAAAKAVFEKARLLNPVQLIHNGGELLAYLRGDGIYQNREKFPLPALVLIDCDLPGPNCEEVLRFMRQTPSLASIPAIVLLQDDDDVDRFYEAGAASYLRKPFSFAEFLERSRIANMHYLLIGGRP